MAVGHEACGVWRVASRVIVLLAVWFCFLSPLFGSYDFACVGSWSWETKQWLPAVKRPPPSARIVFKTLAYAHDVSHEIRECLSKESFLFVYFAQTAVVPLRGAPFLLYAGTVAMADSTQSSAGCELAVPVAEPDTESIVVEEVLSQDPPKLPKHAPRHHGRIMAVNIQSCGSKSAMRWLQALSLIQKEEQARVQKFHFEADSHRSLAGRLLLRLSIALDLECKPRSILLKRTATGKPFLAEIDGAPVNQNPIPEKSYSFNISHHGDWVILSAAYTRAIGIDITRHEKPRGSKSTEEYFTLMRSCFTEKEWALIRNPPPSPRRTTHPDFGHEDFDKMRQFYRHWALKESYLKATGKWLLEYSFVGCVWSWR